MANPLFTADWFPYYFERFEGSDRVWSMSLAEEGAYHRAIRLAWKYGTVSADPETLAARIQKRCTVKIAEKVLTMFEADTSQPGRMFHPTVEEIRAEQEQKYLNRVKGGKASRKAALVNDANKDTSSITLAELEQYSGLIDKKREDKEIRKEKDKEKSPPQAAPPKKGTRLVEPFLLTAEMREYAAEKRPEIDANLETEKFCNYWRSKTGKDATKLDWPATWRNWILNARANGGNGKPKAVDVGKYDPNTVEPTYKCRPCFDTGTVAVEKPEGRKHFTGDMENVPCPSCLARQTTR